MANRLTENAVFDYTSPSGTDVGGTTVSTAYRSVKNFNRVCTLVELGTWNASDDLDHARQEAAQDTSGTGSAEFTTDASGGMYDTDSPIDADGDQLIIETRCEQLDVEGGDVTIRSTVGEDGDSGTDDVIAIQIAYDGGHGKKEQQGDASASIVYVTKS